MSSGSNTFVIMEDSSGDNTIECKNPHCLKRVRNLEDELSRSRSVAFDMLKQRGSWQAAGVKPDELGLEFNSFFTHEIEEMSEKMVKKSAMTNDEARQFLNDSFQGKYQYCKEAMLDRMRDALARVLVLPEIQEEDEELYDISRAYGLLLNTLKTLDYHPSEEENELHHPIHSEEGESKLHHHSEKEVVDEMSRASFSKDIQEEMNALEKEMSRLSWKLLSIVPPLISTVILDAPYCKEWHEKECSPEWNKNLTKYQLVYYRPILFYGYEGKVAQKGWIGNRESLDSKKTGLKGAAYVHRNLYELNISPPVDLKENLESVHHKLYKKPSFRIRSTIDSNALPSGDTTNSIEESNTHYKPPTLNTEFHHQDEDKQNKQSSHVFGIRDNFFYR